MNSTKTRKQVPPSEVERLFKLLADIPPDERQNLAIMTDGEFLFCYKYKLTFSQFMVGYGPVAGIHPVRGDVMDFFAQLEFIVNQIFVAHLTTPENELRKFEKILDGVDFFLKVKLLNEWGLIDKKTKSLMICLKEVRNGFAHNWDINEISYKGSPIVRVFAKFKDDALLVFSTLATLYNGGSIDVGKLIKELSAHSKQV